MLYLSQVIGRAVRDRNDEPIGKVADLIVAVGDRYPPVTGLVVETFPSELQMGWLQGGDRRITAMPGLDASSLTVLRTQPLTAQATADSEPVTLIPTARTHHQHYNVYWQT